jgi:hypothetical protein
LEFFPNSGSLDPGNQQDASFAWTAKRSSLEPISVTAQCTVSDGVVPVDLEIITVIEGLSIEYLVTEDPQDNPETLFSKLTPATVPTINFGRAIPIFQAKSVYLLLKNTSLIPSSFSIVASKFPMPGGSGTTSNKSGTVPSLQMPGTAKSSSSR